MAPHFVVVEGLTGSGKTSVADRLAERVSLHRLPIVAEEYKGAFARVENDPALLDSRYALFLSSVFATGERVRFLLAEGVGVAVDSWWYRTVATHVALGAGFQASIPAWLPAPTLGVFLDLPEPVRQNRIAHRGRPSGYWKSRCEEHSEVIRDLYRAIAPDLVWVDARSSLDAVVTEVERLLR